MSSGFRTLIVGTSGVGKSYTIKNKIIPQHKNDNVIIFDYESEYDIKGYINVFSFNELIKVIEKSGGDFKISLKINKYQPKIDILKEANRVASLSLKYQDITNSKKYLAIFFDEASRYIRSGDKGLDNIYNQPLNIFTTGRKHKIHAYAMSQSFNNLHQDIKANCNKIISFHLGYDLDWKILKESISKENYEKFRNMSPHSFIRRVGNDEKIFEFKGKCSDNSCIHCYGVKGI